jgi:uncharacterized protein YecT (DUF1311 family)
MELSPSLLTATKESLFLHHPSRLGKAQRWISFRDEKNATSTDEEENNSLLFDMYCIASISQRARCLREGS